MSQFREILFISLTYLVELSRSGALLTLDLEESQTCYTGERVLVPYIRALTDNTSLWKASSIKRIFSYRRGDTNQRKMSMY
jgi:hypothetical protein